jgi:hypothetical protein
MIEAVNSVVANASSVRASAEAVSVLRTVADAAPPVQVGDTKVIEIPKAPYVSPYIVIDRNHNKAVLQIRDSDTGDVVQQYPTESRLAQINRAQQISEQRQLARGESQPQPQTVQARPSAPEQRTPVRSSDVISVQEVTSSPPANAPVQAIAAFSAGAQAGQATQSAGVSVFA